LDALALRKQIARYIEGENRRPGAGSVAVAEAWDLERGPTHDLALEILRLASEYSEDDESEESYLRGRLGALSRMAWTPSPLTPQAA
jgi:hypothetical protein